MKTIPANHWSKVKTSPIRKRMQSCFSLTSNVISDSLGLNREDTRLSSGLEGIGSEPDDQSEDNQSETSSIFSGTAQLFWKVMSSRG